MFKLIRVLLLLPITCFADYDSLSYNDLDNYDQNKGLYFNFITRFIENNNLISSRSTTENQNIFIYNINTKKSKLLFDRYYGEITKVLIETNYNDTQQQYNTLGGGVSIKNNEHLSKRTIHDNFLIETYNNAQKQYTVWQASKTTLIPSVLFSYSQPAYWHVDMAQQKIRLFTPNSHGFNVDEFAW